LAQVTLPSFRPVLAQNLQAQTMSSANSLTRQGQFKPKKTKICSFFLADRCSRGMDCKFAHGGEELEVVPDLTKTSICLAWKVGTCQESASQCRFAHGKHDLRASSNLKQIHNNNDAKAAASMMIPPGLEFSGGSHVSFDSPLSRRLADLESMKVALSPNHWDIWEDDTAAGESSDGSHSSGHRQKPSSVLNAAAAPWHPPLPVQTQQLDVHEQATFLDGYMAAMELNTLFKNEPLSKAMELNARFENEPLSFNGMPVPASKLFGSALADEAGPRTSDLAMVSSRLAKEDFYSVFSGMPW